MLLAILSRNSNLFTTRRFLEVAKKSGYRTIVIDPLHCTLRLDKRPSVSHRGKVLDDVTIVLPRIGNSITEYGIAVVRHFELMGKLSVNRAEAIALTRDKMRSIQILQAHGLPVPPTIMLRSPQDLPQAVALLGGMPVVVKLLQGTQGIGVMLVESMASLESMVETLWGLGQNFLLQRYEKESGGSDLRVVVVGGRVAAAMRRQARSGEFRANIHRGGAGTAITLSPEYEAVALQAAKVTGLEVSGVDMLETPDGPKLLEVNSSPGFEAIEKVTGLDIASIILTHAVGLSRSRNERVSI